MGKGKKFPGRSKGCDNIPGEKACKKKRGNSGMHCKNCTAVK